MHETEKGHWFPGAGVLGSWELPLRVLRTKLELSARAEHILHCCTIFQPKSLKHHVCHHTGVPCHWDIKPHAIRAHSSRMTAFLMGPWQRKQLETIVLFVKCVNKAKQVESGLHGCEHASQPFLLCFLRLTQLAFWGQWEKSWTNG